MIFVKRKYCPTSVFRIRIFFFHIEEYSAIGDAVQWPKPPLSSTTPRAITDLIARVLDNAPAARLFHINITADQETDGKDAFELSNGQRPGTILISASSGVAAAWGFNYYLKYVANSSCKILISSSTK